VHVSSYFKGYRIDFALGRRSVERLFSLVETLRIETGQSEEILTSKGWFLKQARRSNTLPLVVLISEGAVPCGAALFHGRKFLGIPTGAFAGGYYCGRGLVIGTNSRRHEIAEFAANALIRAHLAHTIKMVLSGPSNVPVDREKQCSKRFREAWKLREMRTCLSLAGGMPGLMSRFSHKMRRNFTYYWRRAETEFGCVFIPQLSESQSTSAIEALHARSSRPLSRKESMERGAALRAVPHAFSMGLLDSSGNWLSYIAGWRESDSSFVEWQLNCEGLEKQSISTAMRHYYLEHEVGLGMRRVIFVGGTTPTWGRACEPAICGELTVAAGGVVGLILKVKRGLYSAGGVDSAQAAELRPPVQNC
jgi:hypothetical protein